MWQWLHFIGPSGFQQEGDQNQPEIQYQSEEDGESSVGQEEMSEGEVEEEEGMDEESIDNEEELDDDQDEAEEEEDDDDPVICLDWNFCCQCRNLWIQIHSWLIQENKYIIHMW